ncbi:MAG: DUF2226 domain-containing protein [Candidatus Hydrothermarchaeota archaeon]
MLLPKGVRLEETYQAKDSNLLLYLQEISCKKFTGLVDAYLRSPDQSVRCQVVLKDGKAILAVGKFLREGEEGKGIDFIKKLSSRRWNNIRIELFEYSDSEIGLINEYYKDHLISESGVDLCPIESEREALREALLKKYKIKEPTEEEIDRILSGGVWVGSRDRENNIEAE